MHYYIMKSEWRYDQIYWVISFGECDINREHSLHSCFPDADTKGEQPIHKAVQQGVIGNVQVLLDHASEVDPASDAGMTPLMLACYYGYLNIMHLLIEKGANVAAVDSEGCGVVHYAVDGGQVYVVLSIY